MPVQSWPNELAELFARSITAEFASFNRSGVPVTIPTIPYVGEKGTLDISTGLTYPTKAERARRNPRVALLFADPVGEGMNGAPVALVQGHAAVRDADLQANTDRYVRVSAQKVPEATKGQPKFVLKQMAFYYARIWIEIAPLRIRWWPDRTLAQPPEDWRAPSGVELPVSDPGPAGKALTGMARSSGRLATDRSAFTRSASTRRPHGRRRRRLSGLRPGIDLGSRRRGD